MFMLWKRRSRNFNFIKISELVLRDQNQNQNQNQNYIINWDHLANAGYFTGFPEQEKKREINLSIQSDISTIARKAKKV